MYLKPLIFILLSALPAFPANIDDGSNRIIIKIENLKSQKGVLIIALFDCEENYMRKDFKNLVIKPTSIPDGVIFDNIPQGQYAVSVIHDENENGELDKNWVGIPKESFGFSKKSLGMFGPPSFQETSFVLGEKGVSVSVKMKTL